MGYFELGRAETKPIMKRSVLSVIFAFLAAGSAVAQDAAYTGDASSQQKPSDFNNMMTSISNMLSSTNPSTQAIQPQQYAPVPVVVTPEATNERPLPQPKRVDYSKLSPETRAMLRAAPSGLGNERVSRGGNITIERGEFDPQYGALGNGPIDTDNKMAEDIKTNNNAIGVNGQPPIAGKPGAALPPGAQKTGPQMIVNGKSISGNAASGKIQVSGGPPSGAGTAKKAKFEIKVQDVKSTESLGDLLERGLKALNVGQYEVAISLYKQALEKNRKSRDAMFGLATAYQKAGQRREARDAYVRLLGSYPEFEDGLNNFLVLASEESPADALKEMNNISSRNPRFAPVYAQKAAVYTKMNDLENARKNMAKAVRLAPDNNVYRYNMAILLDQMGDYGGATKLYGELIEASYKGAQLPVPAPQIQERMSYISSQHNS